MGIFQNEVEDGIKEDIEYTVSSPLFEDNTVLYYLNVGGSYFIFVDVIFA